MKYIILHIELPDLPDLPNGGMPYDQTKHWSSIADVLYKLCKQNANTSALGQSCWLLPLNSGLPELAAAIYHADEAGFSYKILNIGKNEAWTNYPRENN